jgi:hypothetical protein
MQHSKLGKGALTRFAKWGSKRKKKEIGCDEGGGGDAARSSPSREMQCVLQRQLIQGGQLFRSPYHCYRIAMNTLWIFATRGRYHCWLLEVLLHFVLLGNEVEYPLLVNCPILR